MAPVNPQNLMGRTKTVQAAAVQPQTQLVAAPADTAVLQDISKSLTRIIQLLTQQNTQVTNEANQERKNQEVARRKKVELGLENSFSAVKNTAQAVVAPVKNILDQIIQFFVTLFLGKALLNLINWFANKENQDKVRSIARFLKDWWPSLIAGYLLFGTGFGRVVRGLAKVAIAGTARLIVIAARLAKAIATGKGLKGIGQALSSGGGGGKLGLVKLGLGAVATIGTGLAINKFMGGGEEQAPQLQIPEAPTAPSMGAFGGGFADLKTIFAANGGAISGKVSPFTAFFGSGGLADLMAGVNGVVSGPKGIDKVPAMLTDGEFVMSRGAVQKFGVGTLEAMNAAGGGTNRPRIVNQRVYAQGGGYIGGNEERRKKYDTEHGEGAYDKEVARRKADIRKQEDEDNARRKRIASNVEARKAKRSTQVTPLTKATPSSPQIKINAPTISQSSKPKPITSVDPKRQSETEARKKARVEYAKIINNPDDPRYQDAWDGKITIDSLKVDIKSKQTTPTYTPYISRFAGARDAAHERASRIQGSREYVSPMAPGGMFGGPKMSARMDYAKTKGKYYSSSDQKTYGSYNDAIAAKKSRMTSLASQQGLNKLSFAGAGRSSKGVRIDAQDKARGQEFKKRGGLMGQLGRLGTRMFGGAEAQKRLDTQQKASDARVKQAGAASIGRYFSSSDGKYYKDYKAAAAARTARLGKNSPNRKPITPTPKPAPKVVTKPQVAGGGMGGARGSGSKPSVPQFSASKNNSKTAKQLNIK